MISNYTKKGKEQWGMAALAGGMAVQASSEGAGTGASHGYLWTEAYNVLENGMGSAWCPVRDQVGEWIQVSSPTSEIW
jgi:hypothetical protein